MFYEKMLKDFKELNEKEDLTDDEVMTLRTLDREIKRQRINDQNVIRIPTELRDITNGQHTIIRKK